MRTDWKLQMARVENEVVQAKMEGTQKASKPPAAR